MKFDVLKKPWVKNPLLALGLIVFGFILINLAFILDALYQNSLDAIFRAITGLDLNQTSPWFPRFKHFSFLILLILASWAVFRSKLKTFYKATFMVVPLAAAYATIGMTFYRWHGADYFMGAIFGFGVLLYLYLTKKTWLYYFGWAVTTLAMFLITITGTEI